MTRSPVWRSTPVIFLLFVVAACGGQQASTTPKTITVTISGDGMFSPDPIAPNPGDTVSFVADGADVVLCVDPSTVFAGERYAIANGSSVDVTVQADAVHVDFAYAACLGDLEAACGGCRGGEGGGKTGP